MAPHHEVSSRSQRLYAVLGRVSKLGVVLFGILLVSSLRMARAQTEAPAEPATLAVWAYVSAHEDDWQGSRPNTDRAQRPTSEAATQGVLAYLRAHGFGQVDDRPVADIRPHEGCAGSSTRGAAECGAMTPDAATIGVLGYLRAHNWIESLLDPTLAGVPTWEDPQAGTEGVRVALVALTILIVAIVGIDRVTQPKPVDPMKHGASARELPDLDWSTGQTRRGQVDLRREEWDPDAHPAYAGRNPDGPR